MVAFVERSHSRRVPSEQAEARWELSRERLMARMDSEWPSRVCVTVPEDTSHRRTVPSQEADARRLSSEKNAQAVMGLVWPETTRWGLLGSDSRSEVASKLLEVAEERTTHSISVQSHDPVTTKVSECVNARHESRRRGP